MADDPLPGELGEDEAAEKPESVKKPSLVEKLRSSKESKSGEEKPARVRRPAGGIDGRKAKLKGELAESLREIAAWMEEEPLTDEATLAEILRVKAEPMADFVAHWGARYTPLARVLDFLLGPGSILSGVRAFGPLARLTRSHVSKPPQPEEDMPIDGNAAS